MDVEGNGNVSRQGLTREAAETRLRQYGPNAVREVKPHLFLAIAKKFWAPVPWMLEVTIILELILGKRPEAIILGFLLVFNAGLGFIQENRAQNALALLRQRLPVKARVLREGRWHLIPAEELVPGDFIHVRIGDVMPADVRLADGHIQVDQSTLTGESLPLEAGSGRPSHPGRSRQLPYRLRRLADTRIDSFRTCNQAFGGNPYQRQPAQPCHQRCSGSRRKPRETCP